LNKAIPLFKLKKDDEAMDCYIKALESEPDNPYIDQLKEKCLKTNIGLYLDSRKE